MFKPSHDHNANTAVRTKTYISIKLLGATPNLDKVQNTFTFTFRVGSPLTFFTLFHRLKMALSLGRWQAYKNICSTKQFNFSYLIIFMWQFGKYAFVRLVIQLDHWVDLTMASIGSLQCNPIEQASLHRDSSGPSSTPFPC